MRDYIRKLLEWLLGKLSPPSSQEWMVYRPKERLIYTFWDGQKEVKLDPLKVYKKIMAVAPDLDVEMKLSQSLHKDAPKGHEGMLKKIRDIFNVKPLEEEGLTEAETVMLLEHFMEFCGTVEKKTKRPPTSPPVGSTDSLPFTGDGPRTPNTSASGSTAKDPGIEMPAPLPTE